MSCLLDLPAVFMAFCDLSSTNSATMHGRALEDFIAWWTYYRFLSGDDHIIHGAFLSASSGPETD